MPPKSIESISDWRVATVFLFTIYVAIAWLFWPTIGSMVDVWNNSETYTHGYIILPISLWLVWNKRHVLAALRPKPAFSVAIALVVSLVVWALARLASISVIEQLALIGFAVCSTWLLLGHQTAKVLAFPLFFLFLAVPMGQDLVPPLMEFTADFTVTMLEITGVPVYREGLYFEVPTGRWSVVEACSGIRYLIASVTLGLLYSYLVYRSIWRRIVFVALCVAVPILANGLRAYIIVMIGHLSDMTLAVGVDHLIYGWVFFGIVMAILFWLGSFWSEAHSFTAVQVRHSHGSNNQSTFFMFLATAVVLGSSASASIATQKFALEEKSLFRTVSLPAEVGVWKRTTDEIPEWKPYLVSAPLELEQTYESHMTRVRLYIATFPKQKQPSEAVNSMNRLVDPMRKDWKVSHRDQHEAAGGDISVNIANVERKIAGERLAGLRIWQWYRIGPYHAAHPYEAKLREVQNLVTTGRTDGAFIAVATPLGFDEQAADKTLEEFVRAMLPMIDNTVDQTIFGPKGEEAASM